MDHKAFISQLEIFEINSFAVGDGFRLPLTSPADPYFFAQSYEAKDCQYQCSLSYRNADRTDLGLKLAFGDIQLTEELLYQVRCFVWSTFSTVPLNEVINYPFDIL